MLRRNMLPSLKLRRGSLWLAEPNHVRAKAGGADRDRTGDPLLAKQVLSQLSYSPVLRPQKVQITFWGPRRVIFLSGGPG
jgi:hypothetical protein